MKVSKYLILINLTTVFVLTVGLALAQDPDATEIFKEGLNTTAEQATIQTSEESGGDTLATYIGRIINFALGTIAVIFLTMVLIGGYLWMAAQGNEEQVTKAKKFILNGIFGMMVIFVSYALVFVILQAVASSTETPF